MNFETPLTSLVWLTSGVSVLLTYVASYLLIPDLGDGTLWWKLSTVITCGTLAGAVIPELVKVFTSTESGHVREVVTASREGGASLNILSGFVAGNFSAYWIGMAMIVLMGVAYLVSTDAAWGASWSPRPCSRSASWPSASSGWARSPSRWTRTAPSPTMPSRSTSCR